MELVPRARSHASLRPCPRALDRLLSHAFGATGLVVKCDCAVWIRNCNKEQRIRNWRLVALTVFGGLCLGFGFACFVKIESEIIL